MSRLADLSEKKNVALVSVFAAIVLTGSKTIVGLLTGSLGILAEGLHSGLDLIAAVITYFSVRVSDKPADTEHHFGHGKFENLSALSETVLLLVTCGWIIYEAVDRLVSQRVHIEITSWSFIVVITSIAIDSWRSRALMRVARKHNSQALEADALHFSTDIWSSSVVLLGLICAGFGWHLADSIAALGVAIIVIGVSYRLGKRAVNVLLDRAPAGMELAIREIAGELPGICSIGGIRVRNAGADIFAEMSISVQSSLSITEAHDIADHLERTLKDRIKRIHVNVHLEPQQTQPQQ